MRTLLSFLLSSFPLLLQAESLRIVTDIAPIHSLVSQVAGSTAKVDLLVQGERSAHDFQFTFKQADALQTADLIIWVGPALTPWLEEALETLSPAAARVTLLESDGWTPLEVKTWDETHDDEDEDDHADDHGHDHGSSLVDPHAWLDPQVAAVWVQNIQQALTSADPENAALYDENAQTALDRLSALDDSIAAQLSDLPDASILVPHDAFQYFGARYDRPAAGVVTLVDDLPPTPDRLANLQDRVRTGAISCVLTDATASKRWTELLTEGTDIPTAPVDPLGRALPVGPDHYAATLQTLADAYSDCIRD